MKGRVLHTIALLLAIAGSIGVTACSGAKGEQGEQGMQGVGGGDGVGIESIDNNGDGSLTIILSNGTTYTTDNFCGPQGSPGAPGERGDKGDKGDQGASGLRWGTPSTIDPQVISELGAGASTSLLIPPPGWVVQRGVLVSFSFETTGNPVKYWLYDPYMNLIISGKDIGGQGAMEAQAGGGDFISLYDTLITGKSYQLLFQNPGPATSTIIVHLTFYPFS